MNVVLLSLWTLSDAFAVPEPDFVASVEGFPTLILGFMFVGGILGGLLVLYSRLRRPAASPELSVPGVEAPPPAPSLRPQVFLGTDTSDFNDTGGFSPSDDFEEPTCFAELPRKRLDD